MGTNNREQQVDQLLRGIYRMCVTRNACSECPFYITKCTFGEPKPRTWFDEDTIESGQDVSLENELDKLSSEVAEEEPAESAVPPKPADDSDGTWIMSTTMGSTFTKYVFICSKCGYKKESFFSMETCHLMYCLLSSKWPNLPSVTDLSAGLG